MHHWGYAHSELPPERWHEEYDIAKSGKRQSPINIVTHEAKRGCGTKLSLNYNAKAVSSVTNNGHSVTFTTDRGENVLSGGPLENKYTLAQFHFHWGKNSQAGGSEHTLNGHRFAGEMHFVHWNSDKYTSLQEAVKHPDGLCAVGTLIKAGHCDDPMFQPVIENIKHVPFKGNKHDIAQGFDPTYLLPRDHSCYFTYKGSLTTPGCQECVTWILLEHPIHLSENQLNEFRKLHLGEGKDSAHLHDNFRPVQDLHERVIECIH